MDLLKNIELNVLGCELVYGYQTEHTVIGTALKISD
jgi:hypothetical protein